VACPSNVEDAYALMRAAIEGDDPVIVIENKALYAVKGDLPEPPGAVSIGKARTARAGKDGAIGLAGNHAGSFRRRAARSASSVRRHFCRARDVHFWRTTAGRSRPRQPGKTTNDYPIAAGKQCATSP
jgi:pyruvate dehydrogenase E1 component beta subunit